ncbi:Uncharacterised protein [Vibrio cholerae]|nr:Uncharacterised protein [Vibrio cholerae]
MPALPFTGAAALGLKNTKEGFSSSSSRTVASSLASTQSLIALSDIFSRSTKPRSINTLPMLT